MPCLAARAYTNLSPGLANDLAKMNLSSVAAADFLHDPLCQLNVPPTHYQV